MKKEFKYGLLISLIGLLYLPMAEQHYNVIKFPPLANVEDSAGFPSFSWKKYFDLSYQDSVNNYVGVFQGFRPWLVRQYNTFNYCVLHSTNAGGVVLGKNGQMFMESYILDYTGQNFVGKMQADEVIRKTIAVQKALKKIDIHLIVLFAPGKASFYPEDIPDRYLRIRKEPTNYRYYAQAFQQNGLNFLDLNEYFRQIKHSSPYPLYPPFGTHWSSYGVAVGVDTLMKYIEQLRGIQLPHFDFSKVHVDAALKNEDYDIGSLLNIDFVPQHSPMPYPEFRFHSTSSAVKPDVLTIGDSYWWAITGAGIPGQIFKRDVYWDYFKTEYINNRLQPGFDAGRLCMRDLQNEIEQRNIIILISTEANCYQFTYGFIDKAYYIYCATADEKIHYWESRIKNTPDWLRDLNKKAAEEKKPADRLIRENAEWCSKQACF